MTKVKSVDDYFIPSRRTISVCLFL